MTTTTMGFDPSLHGAVAVGNGDGGKTTVATGATVAAQATSFTGKVQQFEGFLKKVGHLANVVLSDVVKFVVPVAQVTALVDPAAAPALRAFTTSVQLVQATVIATQQRWAAEGSSANDQKLADVLTVVEGPILQLFEQVGIKVDTGYVTNLVNGVVAILNAQPAVTLPAATPTQASVAAASVAAAS